MKESMNKSISYEIITEEKVQENNFKKPDDFFVVEEDKQSIQVKKVEEDEKGLIPREVFYERAEMNPDQYRNAYFTRQKMKEDTAKLGSKVRYKPTEEEKHKNRFIDASKRISKKATLYTYETAKTVTDVNVYIRDIADSNKSMRQQADDYLGIMESTHFTAKMFSSAYIRKNLNRCLKLVKSFDALRELYNTGYMPSVNESENGHYLTESQGKRIDSLREVMNLFSKRVGEYVKRNHVDMESGKGFDGELTPQERISDEDYRSWLSVTGELKVKRKEERMKESLSAVTSEALGDITKEELEEASLTSQMDPTVLFFSFEESLAASSTVRIKSYGQIKSYVETLEKQLNEGAYGTDMGGYTLKSDFKRQLIRARAILRLTEIEIEFLKLKHQNGGEAMNDADALMALDPGLCERYAAIRSDIAKLEKKLVGDGGFLIDERTAPKGIHVLTKEEALSTYSDRRSMDKRIELLRASDKLKKELGGIDEVGELIGAIESYFDKNVYNSTVKAESKALQKALRCAKKESLQTLAEQNPLLKEVLDKLDHLSTGKLQVPEGAQILDKSHPGERPKTRGKRSFEQWFAKPLEDFYKLFRKWEKPADDAPLFAHEPTVNDLRQGKVSNCWMVAGTLALINRDPDIIKDCMKDNGDGTVTVRLYKSEDGVPTPMYIKVTKEVPKLVTGGAIHTSGALWMQILEKAAAFIGYKKPTEQNEDAGYDALWHGRQSDWIFALTGRRGKSIIKSSMRSIFVDDALFMDKVEGFSKQKKKELTSDDYHLINETFKVELYNQLIHGREDGRIFTYSSKISNTPGMTTGHAYTVVSAGEDDDGRFVILRNPYGNMSAKYDDKGKLDQSDSWFSSSMNETCGMFKISYEDFLKNCGELSIIDMKGEIPKEAAKEKQPVNNNIIENNQIDDF